LIKKFTSSKLIQIYKDGQGLSSAPGKLSFANKEKDQLISTPQNVDGRNYNHEVIYDSAYGSGLDFSYETQDFQLRKKLTINAFKSLPPPTIDMSNEQNSDIKLQLDFNFSPDLQLFINDNPWNSKQTTVENQNIILKKDNKTIWQIAPAKAWDSKNNTIFGKVSIAKTGDKLNLSVLFPYSWLKTANYPVTIDPDFNSELTDGVIWSDDMDSYNNARDTSSDFSSDSFRS